MPTQLQFSDGKNIEPNSRINRIIQGLDNGYSSLEVAEKLNRYLHSRGDTKIAYHQKVLRACEDVSMRRADGEESLVSLLAKIKKSSQSGAEVNLQLMRHEITPEDIANGVKTTT